MHFKYINSGIVVKRMTNSFILLNFYNGKYYLQDYILIFIRRVWDKRKYSISSVDK